MNIRMTIAYDGTRYKGWQRLGQGEDTVQGRIEDCLSRHIGSKVEIIGASRTDGGVHAVGQIANFHLSEQPGVSGFDLDDLRKSLNTHLPEDIRIMAVEEVADRFHSRFHCTTKVYHYRVSLAEVMNPLLRRDVVHAGPLDVESMRVAAGYLFGTHDFTTFTNVKAKKKSMVRTIENICMTIDGENAYGKEDILTVAFEADGFLHNMIRRIMGMLLEVGKGSVTPQEMKSMLDARDRSLVTQIAPANGLCLMRVKFGKLT